MSSKKHDDDNNNNINEFFTVEPCNMALHLQHANYKIMTINMLNISLNLKRVK